MLIGFPCILEVNYFILAPCVCTGIFNGLRFWLGGNVNHQEVASFDRKGLVCVCVSMRGMRHCCSLAAICKVNVVENNIHLPTHSSEKSFISSDPSSYTVVKCDMHHIIGE